DRGASVVPSSAVSKTRSSDRVVEHVPVYCRTWLPRVSPSLTWLASWSLSVVGLNWTCTAVPGTSFRSESTSLSLAFSSLLMTRAPASAHQAEPLVGDVQLLDRHLAGAGVQLRPLDPCRQAAVEHPRGDHVVGHAHHLDHAVVARHRPLPRDHALEPPPQV